MRGGGNVDLPDPIVSACFLVIPAGDDSAFFARNTRNCDLNGDGRTDGRDVSDFVKLFVP